MEEILHYSNLHEKFYKLVTEYASVYEAVKISEDWKNPFRNIIGTDIPLLLKNCANIQPPYKVVGSYGKGRWTAVPWIAIFDSRVTTSAQKGVYIVYLVNKDTREIYLTFEIAATEAIGVRTDSDGKVVFSGIVGKSDPQLKAKLQERAEQIRTVISDSYFSADDKIDSGAQGYNFGAVYYKRYSADNLPDGKILTEDLKRMLSIYAHYYEWISSAEDSRDIDEADSQGSEEKVQMSTKEVINQIKDYINFSGFSYKSKLIENFFLSLKSKPFVILAGTSGTGKTRLVKLFAEAIGAEYKLVSVRPDWSDSSDLFGHYDLNGNFVKGPVCDCFEMAYKNPDKPVFLCLDEMNLARVEYYLSDFLSVIESREKVEDDKIVTTKIAQYDKGIPDNIYVVGTVNMDETTFPFSKKVLDRANTIEFSYVDLIPDFDEAGGVPTELYNSSIDKMNLSNSFLRSKYLVLTRDCIEDQEYVLEICAELQKINEILVKANAHVGYRVRDEIVFYMLNNKESELMTHEEALDNEIMQKILPRIQGSSAGVREILCELFTYCASDFNQKTGDSDSEKMRKILSDASMTCRYPKSAEKLELMVRRFEDDGFTSYWL